MASWQVATVSFREGNVWFDPESLFDWNFDELSENPDQSSSPFHLEIYMKGVFFIGDS